MQMGLLKGETILDFGYFDRLSTSFGFWICLALSAGVRLFSHSPWLLVEKNNFTVFFKRYRQSCKDFY
jgi:hypothetical protein